MYEMFRYILVGIINTGLGYAIIFSCMYIFGMGPAVSNFMGYGAGIVVSYFLNKFFTFKSKSKTTSEAVKFVAVFAVAYSANLVALMLLITLFNIHQGLAQLVAGAIYILLSYILNKRYVFQQAVS